MTTVPATPARLPAWALMGGVLSAAGLPIYIYAPTFYAESYGVSLALLGLVLGGLRFLDAFQDPFFGWVTERLGDQRRLAVAIGAFVLALAMLGLFAVTPPFEPIVWFGLTITVLFSAFSFLWICFYAQGVSKAEGLPRGHQQLAAWRESGALFGTCIGAVIPSLLLGVVDSPFAAFALGFAVATGFAVAAMGPEWRGRLVPLPPAPMREIFGDPHARRLLILAFVNATPVALSSTMFLYYVEDRLAAPGWEGPLLVLFFLAAALTAPLWSLAATRFGEKRVLLTAMVLAILSFAGAASLVGGDVWIFAVICVLSGATIGADLTLLPALFARRMASLAPNGGQGFGLWNLMNKSTLAIAALVALPLLQQSGFDAQADDQPAAALTMLTVLYAVVPSMLKLVAIALLVATTLEDD